jgi:hypothetical protein
VIPARAALVLSASRGQSVRGRFAKFVTGGLLTFHFNTSSLIGWAQGRHSIGEALGVGTARIEVRKKCGWEVRTKSESWKDITNNRFTKQCNAYHIYYMHGYSMLVSEELGLLLLRPYLILNPGA